MIRLNRLTDYAIVVLAQMAQDGRSVRTATEVARETAVPLPTVAKLLKTLARHDVIRSQRGAGGGYSLARAPEDISVAQVIDALEGPIALTACVEGSDDNCGVESLCPMRGNWNKVNQAVRAALESVTLADMMVSAFAFNDSRPAGRPESRAGAVS